VLYSNKYNNDRHGCICFHDKGLQFTYTDFEPYGCNRVFPCFDQPDLKARMKLTVVTPEFWNAVSNEPAITEQAFTPQLFTLHAQALHPTSLDLLPRFLGKVRAEGSKLTAFEESGLLATYVYSVAAGFYTFLEEPEGGKEPGRVPMRLYCVP
jgi:aminopeptidase N